MSATFAKAPTLAWLLASLACFLAGMAVVEARHQTVVLPVLTPVVVVAAAEVALAPTATPEPAPSPTSAVVRRTPACLAEGLPHPGP
jgi:hypothetical protein